MTISASSASILVACSTDKPDNPEPPTDGKEEIRQLIKKFENEVTSK